METQQPIKKEFITTWELCPVYTEKAPNGAEDFFQVTHRDFDTKVDAILPNDIAFKDLYALTGKKTKVTIEVIPW